ncbi:MAG TPA: ChaN family lipoprotein [Desulfuromonadaceae bacterium]|jgi:uncharacterized iron-regulated protein
MKKLSLVFILLIIILVGTGYVLCHGTTQVLRLSDGQIIAFDGMIKEVSQSKLIFVGEFHDSKEAHKVQLEIIKKLHQSGVPLAIGMEMFTSKNQAELDRWVAGKYLMEDFIRFYYSEWNMPWPLYRDILLYARDNQIPLIGLNVPRKISRKVSKKGFKALTPAERRLLPAGITCSVNSQYMEFIRGAYMEHHTSTDKSFLYFCEAQMLWNKSMGFHLKDYLGRNPQRLVVVIAGAGHVMKSGIPEEVYQSTGYGYKVILPDLNWKKITSRDSDYLILFNSLLD